MPQDYQSESLNESAQNYENIAEIAKKNIADKKFIKI